MLNSDVDNGESVFILLSSLGYSLENTRSKKTCVPNGKRTLMHECLILLSGHQKIFNIIFV